MVNRNNLNMNKKVNNTHITFMVIVVMLLSNVGCTTRNNKRTEETFSNYHSAKNLVQTESYVKEFSDLGFSIETPCVLKDVSDQTEGDFIINYAGTTDENDEEKFTFYQVMATKLPVGYKDLSKEELNNMIDNLLKEAASKSESSKPIRFGYENYKGYEMTGHHNGYKQKGVIFSKDNFFVCLTVISNYNLDDKFSKLSNGFITLKKSTIDANETNSNKGKKASEIKQEYDVTSNLVYGYKIAAPCKLAKEQDYRYDYAYKGVIETANPDNAVVYMALIVDLPMNFSDMVESDQLQIKSNLMDYLRSKGKYEKITLKIKNIFAYNVSFREDGINYRECMILTDKLVIELIIAAKQNIGDKTFENFYTSLSK